MGGRGKAGSGGGGGNRIVIPATTQLVGSEKQVSWATQIRQNSMEEMAALGDMFRKNGKRDAAEAVERSLARIASEKSAPWIIDRRDYLSLKASPPEQNTAGITYGGFSIRRVRGNAVFASPILRGAGMVEEGRVIAKAMLDLMNT